MVLGALQGWGRGLSCQRLERDGACAGIPGHPDLRPTWAAQAPWGTVSVGDGATVHPASGPWRATGMVPFSSVLSVPSHEFWSSAPA